MSKQIIVGNCIEKLKELPEQSVDCIVTSPPYYGLRDYGTAEWVGGDPNCPHYRTSKRSDATQTGHKSMVDSGHPVGDAIYKTVCPICGAVRIDEQIGLEETPQQYIERLVNVFRECRRVLKDDGTLWLNIGDTYNSSATGSIKSEKQLSNHGSESQLYSKGLVDMCKPKDLIGIPWMLAFALRDDGWYLRQDIIWHKPNPMPESVKDRCVKSHEYIFLMSKSRKYSFDYKAIQEVAVSGETIRNKNAEGYQADYPMGDRFSEGERVYGKDGMRNKRDVWACDSKYVDCEQEASVRQGMNRNRGQNIVVLRKNLPEQSEFVSFMKSRTTVDILARSTDIKRTTIEHWFRNDESGFCFPSVEDWIAVRDYVDDSSEEYQTINEMMTNVTVETDDISKNFDGKRNKRDVWTIPVKGVKEAHFATFPEQLVEPCILAGSQVDGMVLDPFCGSGTTGIVAVRHQRNFIGIELNPEYAEMSLRRIEKEEAQGIQISFDI